MDAMTTDRNDAGEAEGTRFRRPQFGLSGKLLLLTVLFVMLAEVLIFVPSIANYRETWLRDRIASADVAVLLLDAYPDGMVPEAVERALLERIDARLIAYNASGMRYLLASDGLSEDAAMRQDLRETGPWQAIRMAFGALAARGERLLYIVDAVPGGTLELIVEESDLRADMFVYARNILLLSLVISVFTAAAVYLALRGLFVRPIERLMRSMMAFRDAPEGDLGVIRPSARTDEIGHAERELARMQTTVRTMLQERARLAALGLAVAKINHDLRNMLSSAQLFIERIERVPDPTVERLAPKLVGALDRAVAFTQETMTYGRARERAPQREPLALHALGEDVAEALALPTETIAWHNAVPEDFVIVADPEHMFRILTNLARNASEALDDHGGAITLEAVREAHGVAITLSDDGPGVPEAKRKTLFAPFAASGRVGGTGLGLAICDELVRGHGGTLRLLNREGGAAFRITLPDAT